MVGKDVCEARHRPRLVVDLSHDAASDSSHPAWTMKSSSGADLARSLANADPIAIDRKDGVSNQEHTRDRVRVAALELDDCVLDKGKPRKRHMLKFLVDRSAAITAIRTDTMCTCQHSTPKSKPTRQSCARKTSQVAQQA